MPRVLLLSVMLMQLSGSLQAAANLPIYPNNPSSKAGRGIASPYANPGRTLADIEVWIQAGAMYEKGQTVEISVGLTNLFQKPLLINGRMIPNFMSRDADIVFQVVSPSGKEMMFEPIVTPREPRDEDFVVLQRGQSIQRSLNLADMYTLKEKGTYRVRVLYRNSTHRRQGSLDAWMGEVVSDPISFDLR